MNSFPDRRPSPVPLCQTRLVKNLENNFTFYKCSSPVVFCQADLVKDIENNLLVALLLRLCVKLA